MKHITYLLFIIISLIGCSGTTNKVNAQQDQPQGVYIHRLDKALYEGLIQNPLNISDLEKKTQSCKSLISALGLLTIEEMPENDPTAFWGRLQKFYNNSALLHIYKDAIKTFDNTTNYEKQLMNARNIINEEFAGKNLPQFYMHVSGFRENVILLDSIISISIDKYLGSDYPIYKNYFEPYQLQQMESRFITRDYLKAWLISEIVKPEEDSQNLLSAMIYEGKILYALSKLLPDMKADDIIGYTSDQSAWCEKNAKYIWRLLTKEKFLFSTDHMTIIRFINEAPYSLDVSRESPGRVGVWVGWQIVNQYAEKKEFLLNDVLGMDAQAILSGSKYNP